MTDKERIVRLEAAVTSLAQLEARLAHIPPGLHPELDAIRLEYGRGRETRPHHAPEQREAARV